MRWLKRNNDFKATSSWLPFFCLIHILEEKGIFMSGRISKKVNQSMYRFKRSNQSFCNLRNNLREVDKTLSNFGKKKSKKK